MAFFNKNKTAAPSITSDLDTKGFLQDVEFPDEFASASIKTNELVNNRYSGDPQAKMILDRCVGLIDLYARRNAATASQQRLRLYKKEKVLSDTVMIAKSRSIKKSFQSGKLGKKALDFAGSGVEIVEIYHHPVLDFINRPNPLFPGSSLDSASMYYRFLTGNSYHLVTYTDDGRPIQWVLPSQYVTIKYSDTNLIEGYWYGRNETNKEFYTPDRIIHYKNGVNRDNPFVGQGEVEPLLREADLLLTTLNHDLFMVENGNRPDSIMSVDIDTSDQQMKNMYRELNKRTRGWKNGVKTFIARGVDIKPISWNPKDLQSLEKINLYEKRIRFAFGIPESMSDSNASTFASALVADRQNAMWVYAKLIEDASFKNEIILPMFGLDPDQYCFVYDNPISDIEKEKEQRLLSLFRDGIITREEVRLELGWDADQLQDTDQQQENNNG